MESSDIPDVNIQASNYYTDREPWRGRLNGLSFWSCEGRFLAPWIQADIGYQTNVSGVITQGDGGDMYTNGRDGTTVDWVTSLKVSTFLMSDSDQEAFVTDEEGNIKVSVFKVRILKYCLNSANRVTTYVLSEIVLNVDVDS